MSIFSRIRTLLMSKERREMEADPAYQEFKAAIRQQRRHCGFRPGHGRRQIAMHGGTLLEATDIIGCSCGESFWTRYRMDPEKVRHLLMTIRSS